MNGNVQCKVESKRHFSALNMNSSSGGSFFNLINPEYKKAVNYSKGIRPYGNIKLRSNSIFAFQNDNLYSNFCTENAGEISDFLDNNSSNFFGDKSTYTAFNVNMKSRQNSEEHHCSISSDIEKHLDFLFDLDSSSDSLVGQHVDLNKAECIPIKLVKDTKKVKDAAPIMPTKKLFSSRNINKSSESEKSEKYDEVDEFSHNMQDHRNTRKRESVFSASNSILEQFSSNSIEKGKKYQFGNCFNNNPPNFDNDYLNKSINSNDKSVSLSSASLNISLSPIKNQSQIYNNSFNNTQPTFSNYTGNTGYTSHTGTTGNLYSNNTPGNNNMLSPTCPTRKIQNGLQMTSQLNPQLFSINANNLNCNSNPNNINNQYENAFSLNKSYHDGINANGLQNIQSIHNNFAFNTSSNNNSFQNNNSNMYNLSQNISKNDSSKNKGKSFLNNQPFNNPISSFNQSNSNKQNNSSAKIVRDNINHFNNNISNFVQDDEFVLENILMLLKDQNGCRMVQKKIEEKSHDWQYLDQFYEKIKFNIFEIIIDQFGNYVIQKYFELIFCKKIIILKFFEQIRNNLFSISVNHYGTRFFQRALECMTSTYSQIESEALNEIFRELVQRHIINLILDTNGNHVFQKILVLYPINKNGFIYDELIKVALSVAKLKQGGCIFQRAFDYANFEQKKQIVFEILKHIDYLINDEYGNFIIQQIIFLKIKDFNEYIINFLKQNLCSLAKKKFSSNVIDKCILIEDPLIKNKFRNDIIDHMLLNKMISELICDQFGNYVIQKALQVSDGFRFMAIIHEIKGAVKFLKQTSYGRKIYENLQSQYGDYFQSCTKSKNINDGRRNSFMNFLCQYK